MRRLSGPIVAFAGLCILFGWCFEGVLFRSRAFTFRDAGHFYRPLDQYVINEWRAGRVPLWEPEENGGMPLIGNPSAAVLYPGKLVFAALPFEPASIAYTLMHAAIACLGMYMLSRFWGVSRVGSTLAAFAFSFGGPVLFQYCNIIFLVGAAWIPWGLLAAERWLKSRGWGALGALALVLALQTLGGDPQAAYLTAICAFGRVLWNMRKSKSDGSSIHYRNLIYLVITISVWISAVLIAAVLVPKARGRLGPSPDDWAWLSTGRLAPIVWGFAALVAIVRVGNRKDLIIISRPFAGIIAACLLAGLISAAQLLPSLEFTRLTSRAAEVGAHDVYPFSLEPYRAIEWLSPNVFGESIASNRSWLEMLWPVGRHKIWIPSLYLGSLPFLLAMSAFGFRDRSSPRAWLSAIALASLLGGMGEYASPLKYARATTLGAELFGPGDKPDDPPLRPDGYLRDGDGSPYWLFNATLPGFESFRYPSKLLVWTTFAAAALAGFGWDRARFGKSRGLAVAADVGLAANLAALLVVSAFQTSTAKLLHSARVGPSMFGQFDVEGCLHLVKQSFVHGIPFFLLARVVFRLLKTRPAFAGRLAILVVAADLAIANAGMVVTAPRALLSRVPKIVERIQESERRQTASGPFRVHRMTPWHPIGWPTSAEPTTFDDVVAWERDTLMPKYGIPLNVAYTFTEGTAELFDYEWFFFPTALPKRLASRLRPRPGEQIVWYPRLGFDLWNTRYFIVPAADVRSVVSRATGSFRSRVEVVAPTSADFDDAEAADRFRRRVLGAERRPIDEDPKAKRFVEREDWVLLRNLDAFPRAWAVHSARVFPPIVGLARRERNQRMQDMIFPENDRPTPDFREVAWVETEDDRALDSFRPGGPRDPEDIVEIESYEPQRVSIRTKMNRAGVVVLADVYYPGWRLTIDGAPATILRINRAMRGAIVPNGTHRLVYSYDPDSFRIGLAASAVGCAVFIGLGAIGLRKSIANRHKRILT